MDLLGDVDRVAHKCCSAFLTFCFLLGVLVLGQEPALAVFSGADNFASATSLADGDIAVVDLRYATREADEPIHAAGATGRTVWWRYTPATTRSTSIHTRASNFDTVIAIYTGRRISSLTKVAGDDNGVGDPRGTSTVTLTTQAGTTYYIAVDGMNGEWGEARLYINRPSPLGDFFHNPRSIAGNNGSMSESWNGATLEASEDGNNSASVNGTIWFNWTAPATGHMYFSAGEQFGVRVVAGPEIGSLTEVGSTYGSFSVQSGRLYRVQLTAQTWSPPDYTLTWNTVPPPPNDAFTDARVVQGVRGTLDFSVFGATRQTGEPHHGVYDTYGTEATVWFKWVAPVTQHVNWEIRNYSGISLAAYKGTEMSSLDPIGWYGDIGGTQKYIHFDAVKGTTYWLAAAAQGPIRGTHTLDFATYPPGNNEPDGARGSEGEAFLHDRSHNFNATAWPYEPAHAGFTARRSVWWIFHAPREGRITIDTIGSDFDTVMAVYTEAPGTYRSLTDLIPVISDDNSGGNGASKVSFDAVPKTTYLVAIDGKNGAEGWIELNYVIDSPRPPNDDFGNARVIEGRQGDIQGSTWLASGEAGEPVHYLVGERESVWYRWTAPETGGVIFTAHNGYRVLAAYEGSSVSSLREVAASDSHPEMDWFDLKAQIGFPAVAGRTYNIAIDHSYGPGSDFKLEWHMEELPKDPSPAPANDRFVDAATLSGARGHVEVSNHGASSEFYELSYWPATTWYKWVAPISGRLILDGPDDVCCVALDVATGTTVNARHRVPGNWFSSRYSQGAVVEGRTYLIQLQATGYGDFAFDYMVVQRPANDDFADARHLTQAQGLIRSTNIGATPEPGEPYHGHFSSGVAGASIWYRFTPPVDGTYVFDGGDSDIEANVEVYTGTSVSSLERVNRGPDYDTYSFGATAGKDYYVAVDSDYSTGHVVLSWHRSLEAPDNDNFGAAQELTGSKGRVVGTHFGGTKEAGESDHGPAFWDRRSVWFRWTAPATGPVAFDSRPSSNCDWTVAAYSGASLDDLTVLDKGRWDGCESSMVNFFAQQGTTYRIALAGDNYPDGSYTLVWNQGPPANDHFANATTISGAQGHVDGDTYNATKEPAEIQGPDANTIWYRWVAPISGTASFQDHGWGIYGYSNARVDVWTGGTDVSNTRHVANSDSTAPPARFTAVAGTTYFISMESDERNTFLSWWMDGGDTTPPSVTLAPLPAEIRGTVRLTANASDSSGIDRVEFTVGGCATEFARPSQLLARDENAPYEFDLDTRLLAETDPFYGATELCALAYDRHGLKGRSSPVLTSINNHGPNTYLEPEIGPWGATTERIAYFEFWGFDDPAGFECMLDDSGWIPCASAVLISELEVGRHKFRVRAYDSLGNPDPVPASRSWRVDPMPCCVDDFFGPDIIEDAVVGGPVTMDPEPAPTPAPSPTPTPVVTLTPYPSPSVSPTASPSPSVSSTPVATPSPTVTPTVSPTPTPTMTLTPSPGGSPSPSVSATPTSSPSASPYASPSVTASPTVTPSSATPTPTVTDSPSPTPSSTPSSNPSPTSGTDAGVGASAGSTGTTGSSSADGGSGGSNGGTSGETSGESGGSGSPDDTESPSATPSDSPSPSPSSSSTPSPSPLASGSVSPSPSTTGPGETIAIFSIGDVMANSARPRRNFGSMPMLKADGEPRKRSFLKFGMPDLDGPLVSATLRVFVFDGSPGVVRVSAAATDSWREMGLTWESAPAGMPGGTTFSTVAGAGWYEIDVTSLMEDGIMSLVLKTRSSNEAVFGSSENPGFEPHLVVETG